MSKIQELAVWRKQAAISVVDEFAGRPLPPGLEDSWSRVARGHSADSILGTAYMCTLTYCLLCLLVIAAAYAACPDAAVTYGTKPIKLCYGFRIGLNWAT